MKKYLFGYSLAMIQLMSCAGVQYRYYGLNLTPQCYDQGMLLGKQGSDGWDDIPFSQCKPDAVKAGKCVVQLEEDFYKAKQELLELRQEVSDCQKRCP